MHNNFVYFLLFLIFYTYVYMAWRIISILKRIRRFPLLALKMINDVRCGRSVHSFFFALAKNKSVHTFLNTSRMCIYGKAFRTNRKLTGN